MDAHKSDRPDDEGDNTGTELPRFAAYRAIQDDPSREARWTRWRAENAEGIAAYNRWFEAEGHKFLRRLHF